MRGTGNRFASNGPRSWWGLAALLLSGCPVGATSKDSGGDAEESATDTVATDTDTGTGDSDSGMTIESGDSETAEDSDSGGTPYEDPILGDALDDVATAKLTGENAGDAWRTHAALSVSGGCDINGDGYGDFVVGMSAWPAAGTYGAAYVVSGPALGVQSLGDAGIRWTGSGTDAAGESVACVGDTNGDGLDDILVNAPGSHVDDFSTEGRTFLLLGPADAGGDLSAADGFLDDSYDDYTGAADDEHCVAAAGDVNGDGFADVLIGDYDLALNGAAYVVNGPIPSSVDLETDASFRIRGDGEALGYWVASAGDTNADGFSDILLTQYGMYGSPHTYLFVGPLPSVATPADAEASVDCRPDCATGMWPDGGGDVDGDGFDDLIVDSHSEDVGDEYGVGAGYIFAGPIVGTVERSDAVGAVQGIEQGDQAGYRVSGAGDANGDGFADVAMFLPGINAWDGPGNTCVVFGPIVGVHSLAEANACFHGDGDDAAGWQLSRAGDVDGDGLDDLLIGGWGDDDAGTDAGAVWLVGGAAMW